MINEKQHSYLDLVVANDNFPYNSSYHSSFYHLLLSTDPRPHGYILPSVIERLPSHPSFLINHSLRTVTVHVQSPSTSISSSLTDAFSSIVQSCIDRDVFAIISKSHSEPFLIPGYSPPVYIERFATSIFGTIHRGAHLTAYTTSSSSQDSSSTSEMKIWVPRRSATSATYPNMMDSTVAGGISGSDTAFETILHEADEEAGFEKQSILERVKATGVLTYMSLSSYGFNEEDYVIPDMLYVYDMVLDKDTIPETRDGSTRDFQLLTVEEVKVALRNGDFKPNSAVVMIDFLIRHGVITMENEREYVEIVNRMHRRLPFATSSTVVGDH